MKPLRLAREAELEMAAAAAWLENRRPGLARHFLDAVESAFRRIEEAPRAGPPVSGVHDPDVRRYLLRRFPYQIVYVELDDRVQVVAIAHGRRRPRYWIGRIS